MTQASKQSAEAVATALQSFIDSQNTSKDLKDKLQSRKFWLSAAGVAIGVCGMIGFSDNTTAIVVFAILEIVSILTYCIVEGYLDNQHLNRLMSSVVTLLEIINGNKDAQEEADNAMDDFKDAIDQAEQNGGIATIDCTGLSTDAAIVDTEDDPIDTVLIPIVDDEDSDDWPSYK